MDLISALDRSEVEMDLISALDRSGVEMDIGWLTV
jgi:hypothetical protein